MKKPLAKAELVRAKAELQMKLLPIETRIMEIEAQVQAIEFEERYDRQQLILKNIDGLLAVTKHTSTMCKEDNPREGYDRHCSRCALLTFKKEDYMPEETVFEIIIRGYR